MPSAIRRQIAGPCRECVLVVLSLFGSSFVLTDAQRPSILTPQGQKISLKIKHRISRGPVDISTDLPIAGRSRSLSAIIMTNFSKSIFGCQQDAMSFQASPIIGSGSLADKIRAHPTIWRPVFASKPFASIPRPSQQGQTPSPSLRGPESRAVGLPRGNHKIIRHFLLYHPPHRLNIIAQSPIARIVDIAQLQHLLAAQAVAQVWQLFSRSRNPSAKRAFMAEQNPRRTRKS